MKYQCNRCKYTLNSSQKLTFCPKCGSSDLKKKASFVMKGLIIIIVIAVISALIDDPSQRPIKKEPPPQVQETPETENVDPQYKQFCKDYVSPWDGSVRPIVKEIKNRLHDPSSYEHIITHVRGSSKFPAWYMIITEFRCKNAFGQKVKNTAVHYINTNNGEVRTTQPL